MWRFSDLRNRVEQNEESNQKVPIVTEPDDDDESKKKKMLPSPTTIPVLRTLIEGTGLLGTVLTNTGAGTLMPSYEPLPFYDYSLFRDNYGWFDF